MPFRGSVAGFADDHDDVKQRLGNNDWYIYHYFYSQFISGCVIREEKRLVSTLSDSYIMNSQSRTRTAPAWPVRPCQGLSG